MKQTERQARDCKERRKRCWCSLAEMVPINPQLQQNDSTSLPPLPRAFDLYSRLYTSATSRLLLAYCISSNPNNNNLHGYDNSAVSAPVQASTLRAVSYTTAYVLQQPPKPPPTTHTHSVYLLWCTVLCTASFFKPSSCHPTRSTDAETKTPLSPSYCSWTDSWTYIERPITNRIGSPSIYTVAV